MANNPYNQDNSQLNYGTGYPPYQYPQQYPQPQPGGYQLPAYNQQPYSDYETDEYRRQPAYAPTAPVLPPPTQQMMPVIVQHQPVPMQQHQQQPAVAPRPNVVVIHNTAQPNCCCTCIKAIFNLIWTIFLFILFVILVIAGITFLHQYVN